MVRRVFLTQPLPEKADGATLLLPRSFVADGLMTQAEQDAMFKAVAEKYAVGPLFIKTHPRDTTDYAALFPDAVILERTMPSEVLNFCLPSISPVPSPCRASSCAASPRRMRRSC
ncbi:glycosyltransferase family 52 protein [Gemmiger formicilis]|nr:glycosyltransferase family 52 protein [Gemmiger formicilis]